MLYRLEGVTKIFDGRTVLNVEEMAVEAGRVYALLGPNGAGKTTLLDILAFLEAPTEGTVTFHGEPVTFTEAHLMRLRRRVVMVDQHPILFSTTVRKNLDFGLRIRNLDKKERNAKIDEALELVGMRPFAGAKAHRLSGGETQRVALARALCLTPDVILCDEPTASVDVEHQSAVVRILKRINTEKRISVLFTTHDRFLAAALGDETLALDQGRTARTHAGNIFRAVLEKNGDNGVRCKMEGLPPLVIPTLETGEKRVSIDPERIEFFAGDERTGENRVPARVVQVSEDRGGIRVMVDAGTYLSLFMTPERYRQTPPIVGDAGVVHIPPDAVTVC